MNEYGAKRDYRKIDLFRRVEAGWKYVGSTTWSRTCTEAKDRYLANTGLPREDVRAQFA